MAAAPESSSMSGILLGGIGITTMYGVYNKILEYIAPRLMATFGLDVNTLVSIAVLGFALFTGGIYAQDQFKKFLHSYYSCTVKIISTDPLFAAVMVYLEEEGAFKNTPKMPQSQQKTMSQARKADMGLNKKNAGDDSKIALGSRRTLLSPLGPHVSRHLEANLDDWNSFHLYYYDLSDSDSDLSDVETESTPRMRNRKKIKYAPAPSYEEYFYYKPTGHTFTMVRHEVQNGPSSYLRRPREHLELTIYGKDTTPLKMFLEDVVARQNSKDHGRTTVYKARQGMDGGGTGAEWARCFSKPVRSLDTVVLEDEWKEAISNDLREFLLPATSKWYSNRGLPYRRGYLLYGPPGTGKTSLSVALAGKFGLSVYSLSLSVAWMNDDTLALLFSSLPRNCIVLLEDIDACGVTRAQDKDIDNNDNGTTSALNPSDKNTSSTNTNSVRVSFSGLLNAIDGVASKEGRALIMTTNHRERLDEALIRPGRVDLQVKFKYADRAIIHGLFKAIYAINEVDKNLLKFPLDFPDKDEIAELAKEFSEKVPEGVFSPAEVQGFLLRYKKVPRKAAAEVVAWAEAALVEKKEKEKKEKEKAERERKENERKERREKRKREKEEKERKEREALGADSDSEAEETEEVKKAREHDKDQVKPLTNGDTSNGLVNGIKEKLANGDKNGVLTNGQARDNVEVNDVV